MIIPREGDLVRLYIQLADRDVLDSNGRVDKSKVGPEKILEVANKSLYPYTMSTSHPIDWWTLYISALRHVHSDSILTYRSRATRREQLFCPRSCSHRGRCLPYTLA